MFKKNTGSYLELFTDVLAARPIYFSTHRRKMERVGKLNGEPLTRGHHHDFSTRRRKMERVGKLNGEPLSHSPEGITKLSGEPLTSDFSTRRRKMETVGKLNGEPLTRKMETVGKQGVTMTFLPTGER